MFNVLNVNDLTKLIELQINYFIIILCHQLAFEHPVYKSGNATQIRPAILRNGKKKKNLMCLSWGGIKQLFKRSQSQKSISLFLICRCVA